MLPTDELTGYAHSRVDLEYDFLTESGFDDPDFGPAESWPSWTDEFTFEPGPDDLDWLAHQPDLDDVEEARHIIALADLRESEGAFTDADLAAAGLIPG